MLNHLLESVHGFGLRFAIRVRAVGTSIHCRVWIVAVSMACLLVGSPTAALFAADDEVPTPTKRSEEKPKEADPFSLEADLEKEAGTKNANGNRNSPAAGKTGDGDEMAADLDEDTGDEAFGDPTGTIFDQLDRTVRRMRSAARDLEPMRPVKPGDKNQSRALRDLDELIRQIEDAMKNPPSGGGGGEDQPPPDGDSSENSDSSPSGGQPPGGGKSGKQSTRGGGKSGAGDSKPGTSGTSGNPQSGKKKLKLRTRQQPGGTEIAAGGGQRRQGNAGRPQEPMGGQDNKEPGDSQTGTRQGQAEKPEDPLKDRVVKDVWGHLPPHLRDQLLNVYGEKYLPKYEELVRKYYEVLAEQSRGKSASSGRPVTKPGSKGPAAAAPR